MISFEDRILLPSQPAWSADASSVALAEVIGASLDLTETLKAAAIALRTATAADRAVIYLHDPVRGTLRQVVATADALDWDELVSLRGRSVGEIPLFYAVRNCPSGVLELPDTVALRALTERRAREIGMGAALGLALRHPSIARADHGPLGIAFCAWDRAQAGFARETVRAARSIAAQAAVAVANATNHAQGEELVKRLSALASWAARLASAGSPDQIRSRAAQAAGELLDAPVVAHWSPSGVTWYPSPPVPGRDHGPGFATLAAGADLFRSVSLDELPADLAGVLSARGLTHAATCAPAGAGSLLFVARDQAPTALDEQIATLLTDLAASALLTAQAHARVAHLALTDPLTEVGNRRAFEARITQVLALAVRTGRPTSLCLVDLDNFREFNETGGHQVGDAALRLVADALRAEMRTSDQAFRIGGDEFALVLADTPATSAVRLLERVRESLADTPLGRLSITAGVAEAPSQGRDSDALYQAADEALYAGKRAGRGCVTVASPPQQ